MYEFYSYYHDYHSTFSFLKANKLLKKFNDLGKISTYKNEERSMLFIDFFRGFFSIFEIFTRKKYSVSEGKFFSFNSTISKNHSKLNEVGNFGAD